MSSGGLNPQIGINAAKNDLTQSHARLNQKAEKATVAPARGGVCLSFLFPSHYRQDPKAEKATVAPARGGVCFNSEPAHSTSCNLTEKLSKSPAGLGCTDFHNKSGHKKTCFSGELAASRSSNLAWLITGPLGLFRSCFPVSSAMARHGWSPPAVETDGEAANPGPWEQRRGTRSAAAVRRRRATHGRNPQSSLFPSAEHLTSEVDIWHINAQGLVHPRPPYSEKQNVALLNARLQRAARKPTLLCINETWLTKAVAGIFIEGYTCISRRDRDSGMEQGGVAVYVLKEWEQCVVEVKQSSSAERCWLAVHSNTGPMLLCCWYRPPAAGELDSILSFRDELKTLQNDYVGTIVVGDLNVHNRRWLKFSSGNSSEGKELEKVCSEHGLQQLVQSPTRNQYLLDLVLTDIPNATAVTLPKLADHDIVHASAKLVVSRPEVLQREVWNYRKADWEALEQEVEKTSWDFIEQGTLDEAAEQWTQSILLSAESHIGKRVLTETKCNHPWINERVLRAVQDKVASAGTLTEDAATDECSRVICEERKSWTENTQCKLLDMRRGSKAWWSLSKRLIEQEQQVCSIPALRNSSKAWVTDSKSKAELFKDVFASKAVLPPEALDNEYNSIALDISPGIQQQNLAVPSIEDCEKVLAKLKENSGTGPDQLPARILKRLAKQLAAPLRRLILRILDEGKWPAMWLQHNMFPLFKKRSRYDPGCYRGIHLTAQLSKVAERIIGVSWIPHLSETGAFGENQFAYDKNRGCRDALAFLVLSFLSGFCRKERFGLYCSDVSGAFDKVRAKRMLDRLRSKGVHGKIVSLVDSWLHNRTARVTVGGCSSSTFDMKNMLYQGTTWGPPLWNCFYESAADPVRASGFTEVVFADDLNCFKKFKRTVNDQEIYEDIDICQGNLHSWGEGNQVTFDPSKESMHIVSHTKPSGENFTILGVHFDCKLLMTDAVDLLVRECRWKLHRILRTQSFFDPKQLIGLYKAQILSFIEYRTAAIYHCCSSALFHLDRVQDHMLEAVGVSKEEALLSFNLAPLAMRRDIAMLGLIHRTNLGLGPKQFQQFFQRDATVAHARHRLSISEYNGDVTDFVPWNPRGVPDYITRSAIGLIHIYNLSPARVVEGAKNVKVFQAMLQGIAKDAARNSDANWEFLFSPRVASLHHPIQHCA